MLIGGGGGGLYSYIDVLQRNLSQKYEYTTPLVKSMMTAGLSLDSSDRSTFGGPTIPL